MSKRQVLEHIKPSITEQSQAQRGRQAVAAPTRVCFATMDDNLSSPKSAKALLDDDKGQEVDKAFSSKFFAAGNSKAKAAKFENCEKDRSSLIPGERMLIRSDSKHHFKDHPILNRVGTVHKRSRFSLT